MAGSVLRRAYVDVEPDVSGFDASLREKFARLDPGGKAGRQLGGQLNRALKRLDLDPIDIKADPRSALNKVDEVERKLRRLSANASTVEIKVHAERGLTEINRFRKQLGDVGDDGARGFFARFSTRLGPLMAGLPINGPMGAALAAAGAAGAPVFISAFASALSAGAGAGVLGVGLAAVATDPVVKARGAQLGKNFTEGVQAEARNAFQGPVLRALDRLDDAGQRVTVRLGVAFRQLAPQIDPLTQKLIGAGEALTGSLLDAAVKSGPALDGLGDSVTLLADGTADFISIVSDGGPQAAANLRLIAGATADVVKYSGLVLNVANKLANNPWLTGPLLPILRKHYADAADEAQNLDTQQRSLPPAIEATTAAARGQRTALVNLSTEMKAQTDPVFGLLDAQQKLKKAQDAAAEATRKHGRNSVEARAATRALALAAIDLQGKAGALGNTFDGRVSPSLRATFKAAGLTERQINDVEREFVQARGAADKYAGNYRANVSITGDGRVADRLDALLIRQQALSKGISVSAASSAFRKQEAKAFHSGGYTGPGGKYDPAGVVHADEFVIRKESRQSIESRHPGLLQEMNATGQIPGYAAGGQVWPMRTTASMTKIISLAEALSKAAPAFGNWPSSPAAQRGDSGVWRRIVALIRSTGPMSGSFGNAYRPGDPLWHGSGRAVDWMGYNQDALARFLAAKRPLELIHRTRNRDYAYTRGVNKGSFNNALMNAHRNHIHIAMAGGGVIREPVAGVGLRSGSSYSFGERGPETVTPGAGAGDTFILNFHGPVASKQAAEDMVVAAVTSAKRKRRL